LDSIAGKAKSAVKILLILFVNAILVLALFRMKPESGDPGEINASQIHQNPRSPEKRVVRFGAVATHGPYPTFESFQHVSDFLSINTPYKFELKLGSSYRDIVENLRNGDVDIAYLGPLSYVMAYEEFEAKCFLRTRNENKLGHYHAVIVAKGDSDIRFLSDLKGRRFAFSDNMSTSGNLVPRYMLANAGIHLQDLASYANLEHHDSVIRSVLSGAYDAGAVMQEMADQYSDNGIKIIAKSLALPSYVIASRPDEDKELIKWISNALLSIGSDDSHPEVDRSAWPSDFRHGFMPTTHEAYRHIQKLFDDIPDGCGRGCHPPSRKNQAVHDLGK